MPSRPEISLDVVVENAAYFCFGRPLFAIRYTDQIVVFLVGKSGEALITVPTAIFGSKIISNLPRQVASLAMFVSIIRIFERPELTKLVSHKKTVTDRIIETLRVFFHEHSLPFELSFEDFWGEFVVHQKLVKQLSVETPLTREIQQDKAINPFRYTHVNAFVRRTAYFDETNPIPTPARANALAQFAAAAIGIVDANFVPELAGQEITIE